MKEIFDKKFVHFMWDDELKGKEGFVADNIDALAARVNDNIRETSDKFHVFGTVHYGVSYSPFSVGDIFHYTFFYYDPLYEVKLAWKNGKQIQYKSKDSSEPWIDCFKEPSWCDDVDYREKPEKKWRPFKNITELKQAWEIKRGFTSLPAVMEHLIWVRDKKRPDITRLITDFNGGSKSVAIAGVWYILEALFHDYEFLDGTPCGVEG